MTSALFLAAMLATAPTATVKAGTYLVSITGLQIGARQYIDTFDIDTWGVTLKAVCRFPPGWFINAGSSADPTGVISGQASLGVTYINRQRLSELHDLVLVTVSDMRRSDYRDPKRRDLPPAFSGHATVGTYGPDERTHKLPIVARNIRLVPASHCPRPDRG